MKYSIAGLLFLQYLSAQNGGSSCDSDQVIVWKHGREICIDNPEQVGCYMSVKDAIDSIPTIDKNQNMFPVELQENFCPYDYVITRRVFYLNAKERHSVWKYWREGFSLKETLIVDTSDNNQTVNLSFNHRWPGLVMKVDFGCVAGSSGTEGSHQGTDRAHFFHGNCVLVKFNGRTVDPTLPPQPKLSPAKNKTNSSKKKNHKLDHALKKTNIESINLLSSSHQVKGLKVNKQITKQNFNKKTKIKVNATNKEAEHTIKFIKQLNLVTPRKTKVFNRSSTIGAQFKQGINGHEAKPFQPPPKAGKPLTTLTSKHSKLLSSNNHREDIKIKKKIISDSTGSKYMWFIGIFTFLVSCAIIYLVRYRISASRKRKIKEMEDKWKVEESEFPMDGNYQQDIEPLIKEIHNKLYNEFHEIESDEDEKEKMDYIANKLYAKLEKYRSDLKK